MRRAYTRQVGVALAGRLISNSAGALRRRPLLLDRVDAPRFLLRSGSIPSQTEAHGFRDRTPPQVSAYRFGATVWPGCTNEFPLPDSDCGDGLRPGAGEKPDAGSCEAGVPLLETTRVLRG